MMNVNIKKVREGIPTPSYAHTNDAGFDLVAAEDVIIEPGETVKVATGLAFEIPAGYEIQIRPRSGITAKTKLRVQIGTIDSTYRGEVSVLVDNIYESLRIDSLGPIIFGKSFYLNGTETEKIAEHQHGTYIIRKGDRIAQAIIAPVVQATFAVVDELGESERGAGGFGSTGVKEIYDEVVARNGGALERLAKEDE